MGTYILRRLLWIVFLLICIIALTFLVFYVLPGADAAQLRAGRQATPQAVASIERQLGLDDPLPVQFVDYVKDLVLHFDLGRSYVNDADVRTLVLDRLPATLFLVAGAAVLWLLAGVAIGTISAVKRGSLLDRLAMGSALVAISAPVYWLGLLSLYVFADDIGRVKLFPGAGAYQDASGFFAKIPTLVLPWIVLAAAFTAIYARIMRGNLVEILTEDYVRTARAKGLPERRVIVRHGGRSAITPIVTIFGLDIGILMGGAILTETVFNIPGIGRLAYGAIERGDLPVVQGTTIILALGVALASLIVDVVYAYLDPRVRY